MHIVDTKNYANDIKLYLTKAHSTAQQLIEEAQQNYAAQYDKLARNVSYQIGDLVLLNIHYAKPGLTKKLLPLFSDPYVVIEVQYPNLIVKPFNHSRCTETIHVNRTKPYRKVINEQQKSENRLVEVNETKPGNVKQRRKTKTVTPTHRYYLRTNPKQSTRYKLSK